MSRRYEMVHRRKCKDSEGGKGMPASAAGSTKGQVEVPERRHPWLAACARRPAFASHPTGRA